jgi:hypothetical protein
VDRAALMALARDLPAAWNAPGTDARTKQRITHILIREVVLGRDDTRADQGEGVELKSDGTTPRTPKKFLFLLVEVGQSRA